MSKSRGVFGPPLPAGGVSGSGVFRGNVGLVLIDVWCKQAEALPKARSGVCLSVLGLGFKAQILGQWDLVSMFVSPI